MKGLKTSLILVFFLTLSAAAIGHPADNGLQAEKLSSGLRNVQLLPGESWVTGCSRTGGVRILINSRATVLALLNVCAQGGEFCAMLIGVWNLLKALRIIKKDRLIKSSTRGFQSIDSKKFLLVGGNWTGLALLIECFRLALNEFFPLLLRL